MINTTDRAAYTAIGIDIDAVIAAHTNTAEVALPLVLKPGEIKVGTNTYHVYDTAGHDGLKGRVKAETLTQATELGVKAVAAAFDVDYKGNDPKKLQEAVIAKLNLPLDDKIKEKDRDIATMTANWNKEKADKEAISARLKDREDTDRDVSYFPENRIKSVKDKTLRLELKEDGITIGDHEGKPAVFVNGEVKKNEDLTLTDPKTFIGEHFKTKGWITEAAPVVPAKKGSFDVTGNNPQKGAFDYNATYASVVAKHGSFNGAAQAELTNAQLAARGVGVATA